MDYEDPDSSLDFSNGLEACCESCCWMTMMIYYFFSVLTAAGIQELCKLVISTLVSGQLLADTTEQAALEMES